MADVSEPRKVSHTSDLGMRRSAKSSSTVTESTGFGRTLSKKSLDMALRHMVCTASLSGHNLSTLVCIIRISYAGCQNSFKSASTFFFKLWGYCGKIFNHSFNFVELINDNLPDSIPSEKTENHSHSSRLE